MRQALAVALVTAFATLVMGSVAAQDRDSASATVWDGVYSDTQAARGEAVVRNHCAYCHAADLTGKEGPSLTGDTFMRQWGVHPLQRLFRKIQDSMPPGSTTSLSDRDKLAALAFILQQNGMPASVADLTIESAVLRNERPIARDTRPRTGALVRAIGCLARTDAHAWTLTGASDPVVTTLEPSAAADASPVPGGALVIRLLNAFPSPAPHLGRVVRVRGLLVEEAAGLAINVVSIEPAGAAC